MGTVHKKQKAPLGTGLSLHYGDSHCRSPIIIKSLAQIGCHSPATLDPKIKER